jgi:hypothetical protein
LFRYFALLLPLFLCACDSGNARPNVEQTAIESPLQNNCQPTDGHPANVLGGRMMRLNGWQRIGIIASVAWVIGGSIWALMDEHDAYRVAMNGALESSESLKSQKFGQVSTR